MEQATTLKMEDSSSDLQEVDYNYSDDGGMSFNFASYEVDDDLATGEGVEDITSEVTNRLQCT